MHKYIYDVAILENYLCIKIYFRNLWGGGTKSTISTVQKSESCFLPVERGHVDNSGIKLRCQFKG